MSLFKFSSHMQTQKMDQLEQENRELCKEVTILWAEVEKLTNLVSSLTVTKDPPQLQRGPQPPCRQLCIQQPRQQAPQQSNPQNQARRAHYDPIPMKYAELLPMLLEKNLVQTKAPPSVSEKLPAWFRADLSCVFHQGAPGHDIEHFYALKNAVRDLIRTNVPTTIPAIMHATASTVGSSAVYPLSSGSENTIVWSNSCEICRAASLFAWEEPCPDQTTSSGA